MTDRTDMYCLKRFWIRVITKLPNTEQSYKGKGKTHKSLNTKSVNKRKTGKSLTYLFPKTNSMSKSVEYERY